MDRMCGFRSAGDYSEKAALMMPSDYQSLVCSSAGDNPVFGSNELASALPSIAPGIQKTEDNFSQSVIKSKIACHPLYPRLIQTYIDCQKVGAPLGIAGLLEEIQRENDVCKRVAAPLCCFGADPELDDFMETYCDILVKYKSDLARPFDEATTFLNEIEMQLHSLCTGPASAIGLSDGIVLLTPKTINKLELETFYKSKKSEIKEEGGVHGLVKCHMDSRRFRWWIPL